MKTLRLWFPFGRTETIRVPVWLSRQELREEACKVGAGAWEECDA